MAGRGQFTPSRAASLKWVEPAFEPMGATWRRHSSAGPAPPSRRQRWGCRVRRPALPEVCRPVCLASAQQVAVERDAASGVAGDPGGVRRRFRQPCPGVPRRVPPSRVGAPHRGLQTLEAHDESSPTRPFPFVTVTQRRKVAPGRPPESEACRGGSTSRDLGIVRRFGTGPARPAVSLVRVPTSPFRLVAKVEAGAGARLNHETSCRRSARAHGSCRHAHGEPRGSNRCPSPSKIIADNAHYVKPKSAYCI